MTQYRLKTWVPWKQFLLVILYSLLLVPLLCARQGKVSEAQGLPQVKIPPTVEAEDGKIIYNTLDGYTVAVDTQTGKEVWKTKLGDINKGETITMAPLVVKDKVLVGNSGGEFGVRGWVTALL